MHKNSAIGLTVIGLIIIIIASLALCSCSSSVSSPQDSDFTIKVYGTADWSGSIMVVKADGSSITQSYDSIAPRTYSFTGHIVSCTFQKQVKVGTLSVDILKDGKLVKSGSTTAEYGVVSIATD